MYRTYAHLAAEQRVLRLRDFLLRRDLAMTSIMDSVLDKFPPRQPSIFAADAGTTAYASAAIAAAPSNLFPHFRFEQIQHHCRKLRND